MLKGSREERFHPTQSSDQRGHFEVDRDRILYSSALKRLAGVCQVVRVGESDAYHNRLVHTIKVAQLGRRLAQHFKRTDEELSQSLGLDEEVVEAACLAHDLGHPPFGHLGEHTLNELLKDKGGYEGNAQTFRIICNLAVRFSDTPGLNLTRATMNAVIKYPWFRGEDDRKKGKKWGAYAQEAEHFEFARQGIATDQRTLEAEIMDWADDISYSVHDIEDFHRARLVPWVSLSLDAKPRIDGAGSNSVSERIVAGALKYWKGQEDFPGDDNAKARLGAALVGILEMLPVGMSRKDYEGSREDRQELRYWTSLMIGRFFQGLSLREPSDADSRYLVCAETMLDEMRVLKEITRGYVIHTPALRAQQLGQARLITELFDALLKNEGCRPFPPRGLHAHAADDDSRVVADAIASLTEAEAVALHGRLTGRDARSVLDPIVR